MKWNSKYSYLLLVAAVSIPIIFPLKLKFASTVYVREFYNEVESAPEGSRVLINNHIGASGWETDFKPNMKVIVGHLIQRHLKIYVFCPSSTAPVLWDRDIRPMLEDAGYVYGTDWFLTGFYPGGETALGAFTDDPQGLVLSDYYQNDVSEMPLWKEVVTMDDFELAIHTVVAERGMRQLYSAHRMNVLMMADSGELSDSLTYYTAGMLTGIVCGIRGSAEYEILLNKPGEGVRNTDALSLTIALIPIMTILGNIIHFVDKFRGKQIK